MRDYVGHLRWVPIGDHATRIGGRADLRQLLLSNSTHEGALRWVAGLQGGRANTARMVRCVA
jgi:hypothetical protein